MIRFLCANADVAEVIEPQSIRYAMLRISKNLYQKYMATEQDRVEEAYHAALTAHNGGRLQTSDVMLSDRFEKERRQDKVTELIVDQLDALILRRMAGYRNLYSLGFEGIEEVDLAVLAHYPELRRLSVDAGGFSPKVELIKVINTDFLQKCPQLESVTFFKTDFADVDALRGLKSLFSLYLNGCRLESVDFLADLPALIDLHLHNCTVKDVSALYRHPSLRILGVDQAFMDVFGEDVRANATHLRIKIAARRLAATTKATKRILSANDENHSMRRK
jgi:hypothetical protein